jgi:hypothetical protein
VWIIAGGPRCGPCFRLARWIDDHHTILEKDFVIVKVMSGPDDRTRAALAALTTKEQSDPWHAFTDPDGKVLATSEGPLGNLGFPSGVEGLRHFRRMLDRSARRLTPDELGGLINSLSQNP